MRLLQVSTALFTGGDDWLADTEDVAMLIPKLKETQVLHFVKNMTDYNHLDFVWGINANRKVYDVIIEDIIAEEKGVCVMFDFHKSTC